MNGFAIIDICLIVVFLVTLWRAYRRGFVDSVSWLVSMLGAALCAGCASFVLDGVLERRIFGPLLNKTVGGVLGRALGAVEDSVQAAAGAVAEAAQNIVSGAEVLGFSYDIPFAKTLRNIADAASLDAYTEQLTAEIAAPIAERLSAITAFLLIFIVAYWILRLVFRVLGAVVHIPVLNGANRLLGLVCGVLLGIAYTWVTAQAAALILSLLCADGTITPDTAVSVCGPVFEFFTNGGIAGSGAGTTL